MRSSWTSCSAPIVLSHAAGTPMIIQQPKIQKLELYEDKKLNEKIMSSMLPVQSRQLLWPGLSVRSDAGFFDHAAVLCDWLDAVSEAPQAKTLSRAGAQQLSAYIRRSKCPVLAHRLCLANSLAEQLAWRTAVSLQEAGRQPAAVKAVQQLTMDDLNQATQLLMICQHLRHRRSAGLSFCF